MADPGDVLQRVQPDEGGQTNDEGLTAAAFGGSYALAFQIPQRAYRVVGE
jgi:hypothetical protein